MTQSESVLVETAEQLVELVKLDSISYFEYSGKVKAGTAVNDADNTGKVRSELMHHVRSDLVSIRCKSTVETQAATYVLDLAANYQASVPFKISKDSVLDDFIHRVALFTIWPYIRVGVQDLATRIEMRGVTLGLHVPSMSSGTPNESEDGKGTAHE